MDLLVDGMNKSYDYSKQNYVSVHMGTWLLF